MKKNLMIAGGVILGIIILLIILYNVMFISKKEVKEIVSNYANINANDVRRWEIELDYDDGHWEYNVEFIHNNLEYNYTLDARSGEIITYELD